ncbi:hypothetical protein [Mitsuaria sp. GD03876]|uniref:hypothetical protein n=1 Tax=Mitsuaria sp. GD03876 TaxID=2975399 RepID=UPI0024474DBE|nr:hypothetical protein [Mitsuaria sp. GD03876]
MQATTRPFHTTLVRATFGALLAVMAAGAARAAPDDLERVEISGRRPGEIARTDVRATCPDIERTLGARLGKAQFIEGIEGVSTVSFRLNGSTITEARQNRGPRVYDTEVRRAVRSLQCQGPARDTLYVMQISFRNQPSGDDVGSRVALIDLAPTSAGSSAVAASAPMADGR